MAILEGSLTPCFSLAGCDGKDHRLKGSAVRPPLAGPTTGCSSRGTFGPLLC